MTKFYRVSCFKAIGGFVREVMWDGINCHCCRMLGWIACSWDDQELRICPSPANGVKYQSTYAGRIRQATANTNGHQLPVYDRKRNLQIKSRMC